MMAAAASSPIDRDHLIEAIRSKSYDLLRDGGDYGYGGEWHPEKEIDEYALAEFIINYVAEREVDLPASPACTGDACTSDA